MKIGLQIPSFTWPGGAADLATKLAEIARTADTVGFDSIWVMDHFFQIRGLGSADEPMLEGYSVLSYIAAVTQRARLGTLVTGVVYRYPGYLIKSVTNLDVLSGGRAYFGVGAAWNGEEAAGLGFPFPPVKTRFEMLEEMLQLAHDMWKPAMKGAARPFQGKHYQLTEPICSPMPEQKTLRLVAQYGDACNLFARMGSEVIARKLDVLKRHCDDVGRPYDEIERTSLDTVLLAPGEMSAEDVIAHCQSLAGLGIQHAILNMPDVHEITPLERFGKEIIPAAAEF
jgi:alkanesulfonate monooxygenase SsuD/methylene tetrahydromethanopterin reductase-like flavin-dependent oxidoreductase (luciferase family)